MLKYLGYICNLLINGSGKIEKNKENLIKYKHLGSLGKEYLGEFLYILATFL